MSIVHNDKPIRLEDELVAIDPSIMAMAMEVAARRPAGKTLIDDISEEDWLAGDDGGAIECGKLKTPEA